jgi:outer membrane protein OmpA-like peptidoglycan-associated protein
MLHDEGGALLGGVAAVAVATAADWGMRITPSGVPFGATAAENLMPALTAVQERLARPEQPITFPVNSAEPESSDDKRMLSIAAVLGEVHREFPDVIVGIEGHSDDSGPAEFNRMLGLHNAAAVQQTPFSLGVPEAHLRTVSVGESKPVCTGSGRTRRQRYRRVKFRAAVRAIGCAP